MKHSDEQRSGVGKQVMSTLEGLFRDLRLALRSLRTSTGFAITAAATLALGTAGVSTIFTVYDQVLLRPLPYTSSHELVELWEYLPSFENAMVSYPNFLDWRQQNRVFSTLGVWRTTTMNLTGSGDPVQVEVVNVSAELLPTLGGDAVHGRTFLGEEDQVEGALAALLTHRFWQQRFGGDPQLVGRSISLDDATYTVVGVLDESFCFPPTGEKVDLYTPVGQSAKQWLTQRGNHPGLLGVGRLKPGVTLEMARDDMDRVARELEAAYPDTNQGSRVHVAPLQERVTRTAQEPLQLLLAAVGVLLAIACLNVGNLVLARSTAKERELAIRVSLGAGRSRLIQLVMAEYMVLWLGGGLSGCLLGSFAVDGMTSFLDVPPAFQVAMDLRIIVAVMGILLLSMLVFALPPAVQLAVRGPGNALRDGSRGSRGRSRRRFQGALVVTEVCLAVALLIGAGLTVRSYSRIAAASAGIDPTGVVTVEINLPEARYASAAERSTFFASLIDRVRRGPDVEAVATAYNLPLGPGGWQTAYHVAGEPPEVGGTSTFAEVNAVSSDYFTAMSIPLLRGRQFRRSDDAQAPEVAIVDTKLAERYWPGRDPIGQRLKWGDHAAQNPWKEVVGVVGHVKVNGVVSGTLPQIYIPHWQDNDTGYYLVIKSPGRLSDAVDTVRRAVRDLDPLQPLASVSSLQAYARETTHSAELLAVLMTVFAGLAIILAAVGIYGVVAQMTAERRQEIGIRLALGADSKHVLSVVVRRGMWFVGLGTVLGLTLAAATTRYLESQLFEISALDVSTYLVTAGLAVAVGLVANLVPALRALVLTPMQVLDNE